MGGIENHLYLLCGELRDRAEIEVVVCNTERRTVEEVVDGIPVTRCMQVGLVASTSVCPTMAATLSGRTYDVMHIHFPHPMGVISYLASRKSRPHGLVITYHSDVVRQQRLLKLFRPFMHRVMRRADAIVCTSPNYMESSPDLAPYRAKSVCIPYGIDLSQFERNASAQAEAAAIRAKYGGPLIIAVGRLIYYKGFEHAIRAMRHLDARLLIVGAGPLRADLERAAREAGVADRVHLLGEIHNQQMVPYYLASDVFVLPSIARSEAFGIVQLEAMACGLPVVNTALDSGVPFVSLHGETGLTVPPGQPEALAAAIRDLLNAPERRMDFGRAARSRVESEFRKEVMADRMQELYGEVQARSRARG
jgi:rhamnosyl/mannosyltransferase